MKGQPMRHVVVLWLLLVAVAFGGGVVHICAVPVAFHVTGSIRPANGRAIPGSRLTHGTQRIKNISSKHAQLAEELGHSLR